MGINILMEHSQSKCRMTTQLEKCHIMKLNSYRNMWPARTEIKELVVAGHAVESVVRKIRPKTILSYVMEQRKTNTNLRNNQPFSINLMNEKIMKSFIQKM